MNLKNRVSNDFSYHTMNKGGVDRVNSLREAAQKLALLMVEFVPEGRELDVALTRLEESTFHANAGIARLFPTDTQEVKEEELVIYFRIDSDDKFGTGLEYDYWSNHKSSPVRRTIPSILLSRTSDITELVRDGLRIILGNNNFKLERVK